MKGLDPERVCDNATKEVTIRDCTKARVLPKANY